MLENQLKNIADGFICDLYPDKMTQNHIFICQGRNVERNNLDMNNHDDLVEYFRTILEKKTRR